MSSGRHIFYNTILQSLGKIISVALGLVTIGFMTRYLGSAGFGEYTTVISFMGFFGILADLGLYLITTREISREGADEKRIVGAVFALRFVSVISVLIGGALLALFFPYSPQVKQAIFLGILAFTFVSGTQVLVGIFQKYLIFYKLSASEIIQRLVMLAGVVLAIYLRLTLISFVLVLTLSNAVHFFICLIIARRSIPFHLEFDFGFWKEILSKSWPLAFSVVLNLVYFKADALILSALKPPKDIGIYGLSYKILEVLIAFPAMFAGLIMPFLSRYAFGLWDRYRLYLQKSFDAMLLIIVPMIIVALFFARPIINLVGGQGFDDAASVLQILIFAAAVIYLGNLLGYTVVALNAQRQMIWGYLTGSIIGLGLYFYLIPKYTYFGAGVATVVVETIVFLYAYFLTSKISNFYPSFSIILRALPAASATIVFFSFIHILWFVQIILGLALYAGLLLVFKAVPLEFIKTILPVKTKKPNLNDG